MRILVIFLVTNLSFSTSGICTDFRDLNRACPKDNFPTPFIDQILDECAGSEVFFLYGRLFWI